MRVRKIAKQLKLFHNRVSFDAEGFPLSDYKLSGHDDKVKHIMRMTRRYYMRLAKKRPVGSMMYKYYVHRACSHYLYEDILSFWGMEIF